MIDRSEILGILSGYNESDIKIGTICSHSSLQIFHGARREGIPSVGIVLRENKPYYESFPKATPDIFMEVESYKEILTDHFQKRLISENVVIVPHGSFVEYIGSDNIL
ncbi:MAG: DUF1246 domain-containing protein, partial [Nitrososphaerota archaeon]